MTPDEFKIVLEDINRKLDILIEKQNCLRNKFDQLDKKIDRGGFDAGEQRENVTENGAV